MWNTRNAHVQSRAEHHNSYLNFSRVKSLSPRVGHRDITRFQSYQKEKEKFLYNQHAVTSITHFSFMIIHVLMCCLSIKMNLIIAINVDNKNYFLDDRVGISVIILSIFFLKKKSNAWASEISCSQFLYFRVPDEDEKHIRILFFYNLILK